jgi:hypothetical protein
MLVCGGCRKCKPLAFHTMTHGLDVWLVRAFNRTYAWDSIFSPFHNKASKTTLFGNLFSVSFGEVLMCWQLASVSCEIRQSRENRFQPQGCSVPKQGTNTQKNPWAPRQKIMRSYRIVSMGSWGILLCSHNLFSGCIPLLCFVHRGYTIWEVPQKLSYKQFTVGTQYGKYHKNCLINKRAPHPQLMPQ